MVATLATRHFIIHRPRPTFMQIRSRSRSESPSPGQTNVTWPA